LALARFVAVLLAVLFAAPPAWAQPREGDGDEGQRILALVADVGRFRMLEASPRGYTLGLVDASDHTLGALYLRVGQPEDVTRFRSRRFGMEIWNFAPAPEIVDQLVRAARTVAAWDGGELGDQPVRLRPAQIDEMIDLTAVVGTLALLVAMFRRGRVSVDLRLPHLVQVTSQVSIFLYWMIYWPGVRAHLPSIAVQIALAFAADALFCFARFGSWRLGLSPLPVIFSINLFEWFDWRALVIAILVAFGSKAFVHRGGRHIFNPSVAGLTAVGIISVTIPDVVHFASAFHTLNIPPNMAEWVLLVALLPQTRFRILPVSLGAVLALWSTGNPAIMRPSIILAFTLLASDPATTPKTDLGKALFGAVVGFGLATLSIVMRRLGQPDDFAKVMSVAVANALVLRLDLVAGGLSSRAGRLLDRVRRGVARRWAALSPRLDRLDARLRAPLPNGVFVGCWLVLSLALLSGEKRRDFEPSLHWTWGTPLVVRDADGVPRCANNPVFCRPFSFPQEIALWIARARASASPAVAAPPAAR
jgi:hypothetical protein